MIALLAWLDSSVGAVLPAPLDQYPLLTDAHLFEVLAARVRLVPFNLAATAIFVCAVVHTFAAKRFRVLAHHVQERHDAAAKAAGQEPGPSVKAEILHFLGEVEVIFGLWAVVLLAAIVSFFDWATAKHYVNDSVDYTEAKFVMVIMALAGTRPVLTVAEAALRSIAALGRGTPAAFWLSILTVGPLLGSLVTEPAAMTICAMLLSRRFYERKPSPRLA